MAPRRSAAKTAVIEAAEFNFDEFLDGFQRPTFTRNLNRRADLAPTLIEQQKVLDDLDERIDRLERAEGEEPERDITAINPLHTLLERRERLTLEYNDLANEYNESAVSFTFRVPDKAGDHQRIQAMMAEVGQSVQPVRPPRSETGDEEADAEANTVADAKFEKEFEVWWDALAIRSMSVTCTSHDFTIEQWELLRDKVGNVAFANLATAWFEAVQAATPPAPFSPRPLPSLTTEDS